MRISRQEQQAIKDVINAGDAFGYGNMIAHLQTAWAKLLMERYEMSEESARAGALGKGYPFAMQQDLIERGFWDETGERYKKPPQGDNHARRSS